MTDAITAALFVADRALKAELVAFKVTIMISKLGSMSLLVTLPWYLREVTLDYDIATRTYFQRKKSTFFTGMHNQMEESLLSIHFIYIEHRLIEHRVTDK